MAKIKTRAAAESSETQPEPTAAKVEETPFEAAASICSVLVVGLFILTFLAQNFVIPSGSMENTLLVGDHLVVDRITLAPPTGWMPLVHYREPRRGDIIVFIKPSPEPELDAEAASLNTSSWSSASSVCPATTSTSTTASLSSTVLPRINRTPCPPRRKITRISSTSFRPCRLIRSPAAPPESWSVDFPNHVVDGDLVVPAGMYFMMGDNRQRQPRLRASGDLVPRQNIVGRPSSSTTGPSRPRNRSTTRAAP